MFNITRRKFCGVTLASIGSYMAHVFGFGAPAGAETIKPLPRLGEDYRLMREAWKKAIAASSMQEYFDLKKEAVKIEERIPEMVKLKERFDVARGKANTQPRQATQYWTQASYLNERMRKLRGVNVEGAMKNLRGLSVSPPALAGKNARLLPNDEARVVAVELGEAKQWHRASEELALKSVLATGVKSEVLDIGKDFS